MRWAAALLGLAGLVLCVPALMIGWAEATPQCTDWCEPRPSAAPYVGLALAAALAGAGGVAAAVAGARVAAGWAFLAAALALGGLVYLQWAQWPRYGLAWTHFAGLAVFLGALRAGGGIRRP